MIQKYLIILQWKLNIICIIYYFTFEVMLAPFGLAGTLTGHVYKNMDAETSRMMDEWSHFYPVVNSNGPNELSPAVEVLVGKC